MKIKNIPKNQLRLNSSYMAISLLLSLLISLSNAKVRIKSDFRGFNQPHQKDGAKWPMGVKVDLTEIFDLSEAKNPKFSLKNEKHGIIVTGNDKFGEKILLERKHVLHRTLGNHIGLLTVKNELVLIETKNSGNFGESIVVDLFPTNVDQNKEELHCFDMIYLRNYDAVVIGCLNDPQYADKQMFWVYHIATRTLKRTDFKQESNGSALQIETRMIDMSDGVFMYVPTQDIPPVEYLNLDNKTFVLSLMKLDPSISSTISYSIDTVHHSWLLKNKVWTRILNFFQSTPSGKNFIQYEFYQDKSGNYNVKQLSNKVFDIEIGSGVMSDRNQLIVSLSDDKNNVLKICKGNPRNPAPTFWNDCKVIDNYTTGMVDLVPTRIDNSVKGNAVMHYRTWPRETEGGAKFLPGSDTPNQPEYDQITVQYNLNDSFNYTTTTDNIYNFKPTLIQHKKDMTPQFLPNLDLRQLDYFVTIEVQDDDNKVSQTFPIFEATHLGAINLNKIQFDLKLKAVSGVAKNVFGAPWKGNLLQDHGLTELSSRNANKVKFNYQGNLKILLNDKPLALAPNDKLWLNIPYTLLIKDQDPSNVIYYETTFNGGETFNLKNPKIHEIPNTFENGDYFCLEQVCVLTSSKQLNIAAFYNGNNYALRKFDDLQYNLKQQNFQVTQLSKSLFRLQFLRRELLLAPYGAVDAYHAYSFKQTVTDQIDFIFDQNSGILSSFCPRAIAYATPYNLDTLYLLSYCDTDFEPKLVKLQYNGLLYKVLGVFNLNIPEGKLKWGNESEICTLNWNFSSSSNSRNKNGTPTSILFRHGDTIFEINPNNGYDISEMNLELINGEKKSENKYSRLFNDINTNSSPNISKFQCMIGAAVVNFSNGHFGIISPTERGTHDWFGRFRATGTNMVVGSATLVQFSQILSYRDSKTLEMKYYNLGDPSLIYDLSGEKSGNLKFKGKVSNEDHEQTIDLTIIVQNEEKKEIISE